MKSSRILLHVSLTLFVLIICMQCKSIPKLEKDGPTIFKEVYYQKWNAGIKEGGSGTNVYLKTSDISTSLDSIYFRGNIVKLQKKSNNSLVYVGRFRSKAKDLVEDSKELESWAFQIKDDECVISYLKENKVRYFKISNLKECQSINYPTTISNKQL